MANVIRKSIERELEPSFLSYAVKVITDRALPDVRDGLKPVHRRILYGMAEGDGNRYRKSARIVGDVMGKYHPHGDSSIYEAMVRFAQNWQMNIPLVDGQGNFGSRDGDGAAAMRYTEARMTKISELMLDSIKKNTVQFKENYDGQLKEPVVLPSKYPNLLVNGTAGIAVGMATNMVPHNLVESIDGVIAYLSNSSITIEELKKYIKGPDFPTFGSIVGTEGIDSYFKTGQGSLTVRGTIEIEEINGNKAIIVTELPYGVRRDKFETEVKNIQLLYDEYKTLLNKNQKNNLFTIKKPAKAMDFVVKNMVYKDDNKNCDDNKFRTVILLKKSVEPKVVVNHLYKYTSLESKISVNNTVLIPKQEGGLSPKCSGIIELISEYVKHQKNIFLEEYKYELANYQKLYREQEGLIKALKDLDRTLKIIRQSDTDQEAITGLMNLLSIEKDQAIYVMDRKIRSISNYEQKDLIAKSEKYKTEILRLKELIENEDKMVNSMIEHFEQVKEKYGVPRKTKLMDKVEEFSEEDLIQNEQIIVTLSQNGLIKATLAHHFKAQKRNGRGIHSMLLNENDAIAHMEPIMKHDLCLMFTNLGKVYGVKGYEIPESQKNAKGIHLYHLLQGMEDGEFVQSLLPIRDLKSTNRLVFITKKGKVKSTILQEYKNIRRSGIVAINLEEDDQVVSVHQVKKQNETDILLFTQNGQSIRFEIESIKTTKRDTYGVMGIRLKDNDTVVAAIILTKNDNVFTMTENGFGKRTEEDEYRLQKRGGIGVRALKTNDKTGLLVGALNVKDQDYVCVISSQGMMIKVESDKLAQYNRNAQGTKVIKLKESDAVKCVSKLTAMVQEDEEE